MKRVIIFLVGCFIYLFFLNNNALGQLRVGAASIDITPPLPVALQGQMYTRVANEIETPVTANTLILQMGKGEPIVWISCDLVGIPKDIMNAIFDEVTSAVPQINRDNIIVNAIHDHTAPAISKGYTVPEGVTTAEEAIKFISKKIGESAKTAWSDMGEGKMSWGLGHAAIAVNRRAIYVDGTHQMYGATSLREFRGSEWASPSELGILYFWDKSDRLISIVVDIPCPAQVVEGRSAVNGDYMHVVRENLKEKYGKGLVTLGWIGAAGDQSPHSMVEGPAERRMRVLQGIDRLHQLGNRISNEVIRVYDIVKKDKLTDFEVKHEKRTIELTPRPVTRQAMLDAQQAIKAQKEGVDFKTTFSRRDQRFVDWKQGLIDRYNEQQSFPDKKFETDIHVVRLGEIAICTNQFELFHVYGEQIKARSKAQYTFNIQLVGRGTYLPSREALMGGGYSAIPESNVVGFEGGQELVEYSLEVLNPMFENDLHQGQRESKNEKLR